MTVAGGRWRQTLRCLCCLGLLWFLSGPLPAGTVVGDGLVLSCTQPDALKLRCDYRLTPGKPLAAVARVGDIRLPAPTFATRTGDPGSIAVLLLVDTSDPGRAAAIDAIRAHIATLVDTALPHHRLGLATFDSDLALLAPIGSTADALKAAAASLQATGRTTELYRNVVEAVKRLATATDEHKVLVVFSDGLAEDRAYFHRDAIDAALDARITIHAIGYPRSVAPSVGLQSLRRLAAETGGRFVAANPEFALPDGFFDAPIAGVWNIGALEVNLDAAAERLSGGPHRVRIGLETGAGLMEAEVSVTLPMRSPAGPVVKVLEVEVPRVVEVEKVIEVPAPRAIAPRPAPPPPASVPLWYWILAIGLLALALVILLLVLVLQRRAGPRPAAAPSAPAVPPTPLTGLAYLTLADDPQAPRAITSATFLIGRLSDNDLVLRDPSVSRHHAEIRRRRDGSFQVLDLDSMNGVLVNSKKLRDGDLHHGDLLEVGDVSMTFSVGQDDDFGSDDTVMTSTVLPDARVPEAAGGKR